MREGSALVDTNHPNVYLWIEIHFGSSGTSLDTLAPRVGQGGVENPFYDLRQVSNCLDLLDVHLSDLNEGNRARAGSLYAIFDPPLKGVKSHFLRLRPKAARGCFALLGTYLSMYLRTICPLPALPRPRFPPREIWTHLGENS